MVLIGTYIHRALVNDGYLYINDGYLYINDGYLYINDGYLYSQVYGT